MACMTFECTRCPWVGFGNGTSRTCPTCGSACVAFWDEAEDHDEDEYNFSDADGEEDEQERYEREQDDVALHGDDD